MALGCVLVSGHQYITLLQIISKVIDINFFLVYSGKYQEFEVSIYIEFEKYQKLIAKYNVTYGHG